MTPPSYDTSPSIPSKSIEEARAEMLQEERYDYYLMTFDSHVRLDAFLTIEARVADPLYWKLLRDVWISSEVTLPHKSIWLDLLKSKRPGREGLMICSERRFLARLPDVVTIYRGCGHVDGIYGLSWTLDYERAKFFAAYACGHRRRALCPKYSGTTPTIAKATCSKADVLAYIGQRDESEIVVDPIKVNVLGAREWRKAS